MRLKNKVAIVTGSSRGIGRAMAVRMAAEGAKVVVHGKTDGGRLGPIAESIRKAGGEAVTVAADLGDPGDVDRVFDETVRAFGTVDVLVNNAAWSDPTAHFLEMDVKFWDDVMRSNMRSLFLMTHRAARVMVEQKKAGSIVNITSFAAARAHRNMSAYDASKGGMEAFTRSVALDLAPFGIRVNAVGPGAIMTEQFKAQDEAARKKRGATVPLGRGGEPDEVARVVAFMASDDASYVTGQILYVDGGMLAQLRSPQADVGLPDAVRKLLG